MATTNYGFLDVGVTRGGDWVPVPATGHPSAYSVYAQPQVDFMVTGSSCILLNYFFTNNDMTLIVDGTTTNPTITAPNTWQTNLTLFSGLSDAPHHVTIKSGTNPSFDAATGAFISVTGAAPALAYATNFGPVTILNDAGTSPHVSEVGWAASSGVYGHILLSTVNSDPSITFYASMSAFQVRAVGVGYAYELKNMDTGATYSGTDVNNALFQWILVGTGLDSARHLWRISVSMPAGQNQLLQFCCSGGTGFDYTGTVTVLPVLVGYGDSITHGTDGTSNASWLNWTQLVADSIGYSLFNLGLESSTVNNGSGTAGPGPGETSTRCNQVIAAAPTKCIILYGINDIGSGVTTANFSTSFQNMCTQLQTGLPSCQFYVVAILPGARATQAQLDVWNPLEQAVVAGMGANWHWIDSKPWNLAGIPYKTGGAVDPTYFIDNVHPNALGSSAVIAPNLLASIAPPSGNPPSSADLVGGMQQLTGGI